MQVRIRDTLDEATAALRPVSVSARLDSEILLALALRRPRSHLRAWPERALSESERRRFHGLLERRRAGEPVAYLTGEREFWSLPLRVDRATLIPRPETELLVELALRRIAPGQRRRVLDLGTGCGAIALAIAVERPACSVTATDISAASLRLARANLQRLGLSNVDLRQGNWYAPLAGQRFDLIATNPPYVATEDPHLERGDARWEPRLALEGGRDGLGCIAGIAAQAGAHLEPGGWLLLEHGYDQAGPVQELLRSHGFERVRCYHDAAGLPRACAARARAQTGQPDITL